MASPVTIQNCSDSSCCSKGYHWSAEKGCVDIEECVPLALSACRRRFCQNTPGSFECVQPSSSTRSGLSAQSTQIDCGHTICPVGMDCLLGNDGIMDCVDPCKTYKMTGARLIIHRVTTYTVIEITTLMADIGFFSMANQRSHSRTVCG